MQKCIFQTKPRLRRSRILGILQPGTSFEYGLAVGGISSRSVIKMIETQAKSAQIGWQETGELIVIVLDNYYQFTRVLR